MGGVISYLRLVDLGRIPSAFQEGAQAIVHPFRKRATTTLIGWRIAAWFELHKQFVSRVLTA